jgi:hypothetical protein
MNSKVSKYLQLCRYYGMHTDEYMLNILGNRHRQRQSIHGTSYFHQVHKPAIFYNHEGVFVLGYPANDFNSGLVSDVAFQVSNLTTYLVSVYVY